MNESLRMELFEFLRENLSIDVSMDTEYESCSEYATCNVTLSIRNPESGKYEEIGNAYDSVCINRD